MINGKVIAIFVKCAKVCKFVREEQKEKEKEKEEEEEDQREPRMLQRCCYTTSRPMSPPHKSIQVFPFTPGRAPLKDGRPIGLTGATWA